jgi:hypothetical protein
MDSVNIPMLFSIGAGVGTGFLLNSQKPDFITDENGEVSMPWLIGASVGATLATGFIAKQMNYDPIPKFLKGSGN